MNHEIIEKINFNTAKIEIDQAEKVEDNLIKEFKELNDKCDVIINKIKKKHKQNKFKLISIPEEK